MIPPATMNFIDKTKILLSRIEPCWGSIRYPSQRIRKTIRIDPEKVTPDRSSCCFLSPRPQRMLGNRGS